MFNATEIADTLAELGVTHVVWLPDSTLGQWETSLEDSSSLQLIRVCREGEAWALAAGLLLGGKSPVVVIQTTGLFESGDALRNVLFDLRLPIFAIIGARNWLIEESRDTAKTYAEPILRGWEIDYRVIAGPDEKPQLEQHYRACQKAGKPGAILLGEGKE